MSEFLKELEKRKEKKKEEEEKEEEEKPEIEDVDEELKAVVGTSKLDVDVEPLKLVEYRYFRERLEGKRGSLGKEGTLQRLKRLVEKHLEIVKKKKKN